MAGLHLALVERVLDEASHGTSVTEEASAKRLYDAVHTGEHDTEGAGEDIVRSLRFQIK
jgi:hypothetical protein